MIIQDDQWERDAHLFRFLVKIENIASKAKQNALCVKYIKKYYQKK